VYRPLRRIVAELDVPPPLVGGSVEHRRDRSEQTCDGKVVAENED